MGKVAWGVSLSSGTSVFNDPDQVIPETGIVILYQFQQVKTQQLAACA